MKLRKADLNDKQIIALIALHLAGMQANSPANSVNAKPVDELNSSNLDVWSIWAGNQAIGIGGLKYLNDEHADIKSMRTHPDHLRKGVASRLLQHLIFEAKAQGVTTLSLETGSGPTFEPALNFYRRHGFMESVVFADYKDTHFNRFMQLS